MIGILGFLFLGMFFLKLLGMISISWLVVFLPLLIGPALFVGPVIVGVICGLLVSCFSKS